MKWWSLTIHVDLETGEILTKETTKRNYNIITTKKKVTINEQQTIGHILYVRECRRKQQLEIFGTDNK